MSYSTILAEIKEALNDVASIGVVHDYERWSNDWNTFLSLFKDDTLGKILGWTITRSNTDETEITQLESRRDHTYIIRGYHQLDDSAASEKTFQNLIEDVMGIFRAKVTWEGTAVTSDRPKAITEHRMFGSVLCHYCEIRVFITEIVTVSLTD